MVYTEVHLLLKGISELLWPKKGFKEYCSHADLCLRRPNSSPNSTWPLGLKSNSKADRLDFQICSLESKHVVKSLCSCWCLQIIDWLNHLVYVHPVQLLLPGFHHQQAVKTDRWSSGRMNITANVPQLQCVWVCSHNIRVCGVWHSKRSSVMFPIQLGLFMVQLIQSATNFSTFQQPLVVLRNLQS